MNAAWRVLHGLQFCWSPFSENPQLNCRLNRHGNGTYGHRWFRCPDRFSKKTRETSDTNAKMKDESDLEKRRREAGKELPGGFGSNGSRALFSMNTEPSTNMCIRSYGSVLHGIRKYYGYGHSDFRRLYAWSAQYEFQRAHVDVRAILEAELQRPSRRMATRRHGRGQRGDVEHKATEKLSPAARPQLIGYLRATPFRSVCSCTSAHTRSFTGLSTSRNDPAI